MAMQLTESVNTALGGVSPPQLLPPIEVVNSTTYQHHGPHI
jgi:hypothetical protein